ncbi:hypothetical protein LCGC14_1705350 [marine sediment metagenome]|uniref:1-deoxy-D-xylulose-5-phosphate synthase n=1 Tax=marine sediment metagenome TaxID=412755 RepID=A0A0F9HHD0_9ZZZZ
MNILETINCPDDLKKLSPEELSVLAQEMRDLMIETVLANGGHLASNLGVVELTIALHQLFHSPTDRIIFDTSHQCYAHKMLTGRARDFRSIRTRGGYSGFYEPSESPHDVTVMGHAGCGPSLALGLAVGETLKGGSGYTVCVIGDGALTAGLAYEGLSNIIQQAPRNLMVILNDNGMSISENVGWMAQWRKRWLPHLRDQLELDADFQSLESLTEALAPKVPLGPLVLSLGRGIKNVIGKAITPELGHFWEEMGFTYLGPVDGHNIEELEDTLARARRYSDRVPLVHVLTQKGRGYTPAEGNPVQYHQPSSPKAGAGLTYSQAFADTLGLLMAQDQRIVAISAAMLDGTGLAALKTRFPNRVFDVGICEQHAVSMAAGMARAGLKPVFCVYSTFLQRAFDQVVHDVCLNDLPVVFGVDRAGIVGQDGKTHQGLYDMAYMRIPPNMVLAVPRDENELGQLLYTAINQDHPFTIRYPRGEGIGVGIDMELRNIQVGTAEIVREGKDICLAAVGPLVHTALSAALDLAQKGVEAQVVNVRFVKPIDPALIEELCEHFTDVVVLEEGTLLGGVGAAILEAISRKGLSRPRVHQASVGDIFLEHGGTGELRHTLGLDSEGIVERVQSILGGG